MKVLDLFAGRFGWSRAFAENGHDVTTIEKFPQPGYPPTIEYDVMRIEPMDVEAHGPFDIILASPPCTCFSIAACSHHWTKDDQGFTPKHVGAWEALELVQHTRYLIDVLAPKAAIIENPRGLLRKMPVLSDVARTTVTYCQYGEKRMKPTDLWLFGAAQNFYFHPMCKNGATCHERAPRGAKTGTQGIDGAAARSVVPYALSISVCDQMERLLAGTLQDGRLAV